MTVKRKALEVAATELNFFLDPNPPISIKEKSDVLKVKIIEAGNLLEEGEQELSLSTETGLEGDELKKRKEKIAGIQSTLKELGVKLFGGEEVQDTEKTGVPLVKMLQEAKKLVDLKAIVEAEDEFESLREKLDTYTGLHGPHLLRIDMLELLGKISPKTTASKTEKVSATSATIQLKVKDNPKKKGSKSFDRFELYKDKMTVQDYVKAGGQRADIKWDVNHGFISTELT